MTKLGLYGTAIVVPDRNRLAVIHPNDPSSKALVPWMHFDPLEPALPSSKVWGKKLGAIRFVEELEHNGRSGLKLAMVSC